MCQERKRTMNEILKYILEIVIGASVVILVRFIIPWLKAQIESSNYKWIYDVILDAVQYAEQTIHGEGTGPDKKIIVQQLINEALRDKKQYISDEQINAIIESCVYVMNREIV